jgi:DNA modification methylase
MSGKKTVKPKAQAAGIPVYCAHDAIVRAADLIPNPKNPNKHPQGQIEALGAIIRGSGWRNPITVSTRSGLVVKGHGRLLAAQLEELDEVPVDYQDYESEAAELADLTADNRIAELAETDNKLLVEVFAGIDAGDIDFNLSGYSKDEYSEIAAALNESLAASEEPEEDLDDIPETPSEPVTQYGDVWILGGRHRVMCGNCTVPADRDKLLDGAAPQILLTDPPYCSGGFQETGKSTGSIGTVRADGSAPPKIANDILSTRGYQNLIGKALADIPCQFAYIFTDWRMWVYLFDLVEGAGFGIKSMIVWNKKTPGMGVGWRSQHELVCFGNRGKVKFDNHKGYGNVIECSRSGNELHPTQKPEEVFEILLDNMEWAQGVYDPFGGSGTTLTAAEAKGQQAYIMELTPHYTDVIVKRWLRVTGGGDVKLIRNGVELPPEEYERIFETNETTD